jgi:Family of unknown function (DUF5681)
MRPQGPKSPMPAPMRRERCAVRSPSGTGAGCETKRDYKIGYGKPPRGRPFQKGQSGNPRGNNLSALLIAALNEPAYVTIDGKRRKITKREAIVTQDGQQIG